MSYLCFPVWVVDSWVAVSWNGERYAPLKWTPTRGGSLRDARKARREWDSFQSGTTLEPSTAERGVESWISYLRDSRVNPSALQESKKGATTKGTFGRKPRESFARLSPDGSSWKTSQVCLLAPGTLASFSETWPPWGSMRNGVVYQRRKPAHLTRETGSGLFATPTAPANQMAPSMRKNPGCRMWQTPVADDAVKRRKGKFNSRGEPKLSAEVKMWPTPMARDWKSGKVSDEVYSLRSRPLGEEVLRRERSTWPTPTQSDVDTYSLNQPTKQSCKDSLCSIMRREEVGHLSPEWTEWLMGWPVGWTDVDESYVGIRIWEGEHITGSWWNEEPVPRVTTNKRHRTKRLRAIGNGQVPTCVVRAWNILSKRFEEK